jgi:hypothetical protein
VTTLRSFVLVFSLGAARVAAGEVVLYDGTNPATPEGQGFLRFQAFPPGSYFVTAGGVTTIDTTLTNAISAGFHDYNLLLTGVLNPALPPLDRVTGFTVTLDVRIEAEAHASVDRAGFSLIALSQDLRGIELGFWTDLVWAQSGPSFTHAEEGAIDTTARVRRYALSVLGDSYSLTADGVSLLTGPLRDMSSFGSPYDRPRFVFVGDDTSSARARALLTRLAVAVPDPPAPGLRFHTVAPCRVVDTRDLGAPVGGPALAAQQTRTILVTGHCSIPTSARAVSANLAVTEPGADGDLRVSPKGAATPSVSALNYIANQTRANSAVVGLNASGEIAVYAAQAQGTTAHLILDVNGYFE